MGRPFNFAEGEFYHLYNRGTDKRDIFLATTDYERFKTLLFLSNSSRAVNLEEDGASLSHVLHIDRDRPLVAIGAYCLMPNHFHLLVQEISHGGISKFMQKLTTGYTMYFNKLNDRTGGLFQGKFKAEHAAEDRYLKYLYAYIHLNPAKLVDSRWRENGINAAASDYVKKYPYSSYQDYTSNGRKEIVILSKSEFPEYFTTVKDFEDEMNGWLNYAEDE